MDQQTVPLSLLIIDATGGVPLFSTLSSSEAARLAGLLQATRGTVLNHPKLRELGDVHRLKYGHKTATVLPVESMILVALSSGRTSWNLFAEKFLDFVYAKLIFAFTSQIHMLVRQNATIDLEGILIPRDASNLSRDDFSKRGLSLPRFRPITLVTASVQMFGPLPSNLRRRLSLTLKHIGDSVPNTVFALLCIGHELVSIVQTAHGRHHIHSSPDLDLLLTSIQEQNSRLSDVWLPICLPCISSDGYLHCFARQFDPDTNLTVALVSSDSSTTQFQRFRNAAMRMQDQLGLSYHSGCTAVADDEGFELVTYPTSSDETLFESILSARSDNEGLKHRLMGTDCLHFVARQTYAIQGNRSLGLRNQKAQPATKLAQIISGGVDCYTLWEIYARLGLLLEAELLNKTRTSLMTQLNLLSEELSFAYEHHSDYLVFVMTNVNMELYVSIGKTAKIETAYKIGQGIMERIMTDRESLFLSDPLSFND